MIKASVRMSDGRVLMMFGLSDRNLQLLKQGKPISFPLEPLGGSGAVTIFHGDTEQAMRDMFGDFVGPNTHVTMPEDMKS